MQQQVPLAITTSNKTISGHEQLENCYAEQTQGGKYGFTIKGTAGLAKHTVLPYATGVKALHEALGRAFAITSDALYEITASGTYINRGSLTLTGTRVVAEDNGFQLVMVDGIKGYSFVFETNTLTEITAEGFYPAASVTTQDGYFIFDRTGTRQFFITGIFNVEFDPLEIASANGQPDNIMFVLSDHRELIIFCERTIEFWYNSGATDFPFQRSEGSFVERGLGARYSPAKLDDRVYFVSDDRNVYSLAGYQTQQISTTPVSDDLQGVNIDDCFGLVYTEGEDKFYQLTIPGRNKTWVYNIKTGSWFVRSSNQFGRHMANNIMRFDDKNLVGDFQAGVVYEMTHAAKNDDGEPILKRFVLPTINVGRSQRVLDSFELDMLTGVGTTNGPSSDPKAALRISKDDGSTWSSSMLARIGKKGERKTRTKWNRLGVGRQFLAEITVTADIDLDVGGAWIEFR